IYAIGGYNLLGTVEAYNPNTNAWITRAQMPTGRSDLAATLGADGKIYAMGGNNGSGGEGDQLGVYNPTSPGWMSLPSLLNRRYGLGGATGVDGKIYAIGGDGLLDTYVEAYSTSSGWVRRTDLPTARYKLAVVAAPDGRIYAIGGTQFNNILQTQSVVEAYD